MASFSSWEHPANYDPDPGSGFAYNHKVHGSRYLLTDVLKGRIGFDGIVISDWDAHAEVAGCTIGDAGPAILAGLDVLMVAGRDAWRSVYRTTVERVQARVIPMSRIDDAVTRILRVKMRAGLWEHPDEGATDPATGVLGCQQHRRLSREAARESIVLLKNARRTLPLPRTTRVLVAGSGATEIQKQTGGWTLSWQGDDVDLGDVPGASTVAMAVAGVVGPGRSTVDPWLDHADPVAHDVAVVVIGEDAYAEMRGTIKPWRGIAYAALKPTYARDLATLRTLRAAGAAVVTVLLTGRPLYVTEEINLSDAFVVAWLPGPQGVAVTDLLFAARGGGPVHDFQGRLAHTWPARKDSMAVNRLPPHIPDYRVPPEEVPPVGLHAPLFPYGYGLTLYGDNAGPADRDLDNLPLHVESDRTLAPPADGPIEILRGGADTGYRLRIGGHHTWSRLEIADDGPTDSLIVRAEPVPDPRGGRGMSLRFKGFPAFVYAQADDGRPRDLRGYHASGAEIVFEVLILEQLAQPLYLACHDDYPAQPGLDLTERLNALPLGEWTTLHIPLTEIASIETNLRHVDVPFMLYTAGRAHVHVGAVRWL
jgi:beta-glucosidase